MKVIGLILIGLIALLGELKAERVPVQVGMKAVSADNDTLRQLGRVVKEGDRLGLYWAACGVELTCKTTTLVVEMDSDAPDNYVQVVIDDRYDTPVIIRCTPGRKLYRIAEHLPDTWHKFTLRRRTDPTTMGCFLYTLWVDGQACLRVTPAKSLKVEYYGDSVSSGHGDEADVEGGENPVDRFYWNPMKAFTGYSAQLADADYAIISKSGIGLMVSWYDQVLGDIYDLDNPHDYSRKHDFTSWQPDIVVINVMQNDSWLLSKLDPVPGEKTIVERYCGFVRNLLSVYPKAQIICALGPMNIVDKGSPWPGYVEKSVKILRKENPGRHISSCFFPYLPTKDHPTVKEHEVAARILAARLK